MNDTSNHPVWDVYDLLRTARLNIKYYSHKLTNLKRINFYMEVALAIGAPSSAIGVFYFWNTTYGSIIWKWILGIIAVVALVKPFIKLSDKIGSYEKTVNGYRILEHQVEKNVIQIRQDKSYSEKHRTLLETAIEMEGKLKENDPETKINNKLRKKYQEEVLKELPAKKFYIPR
jgi:hypothetical protein